MTLRWTQRYVVLVLRVVVPGGGGSEGRECRGWSGGGWSGGSGTPAVAAATPRKAALDAGVVVHLALKSSRSDSHLSFSLYFISEYYFVPTPGLTAAGRPGGSMSYSALNFIFDIFLHMKIGVVHIHCIILAYLLYW